jgi:hypothetical protein
MATRREKVMSENSGDDKNKFESDYYEVFVNDTLQLIDKATTDERIYLRDRLEELLEFSDGLPQNNIISVIKLLDAVILHENT